MSEVPLPYIFPSTIFPSKGGTLHLLASGTGTVSICPSNNIFLPGLLPFIHPTIFPYLSLDQLSKPNFSKDSSIAFTTPSSFPEELGF
ncbi:hypothetical protein [Clostridioides difficile]|uniref:hypothetical protein n=1 Tax=Clostridioides difficile TaxID=1496 RepID=UPI0028A8C867|nr:hypothetical protein [Clostridioides difficile]